MNKEEAITELQEAEDDLSTIQDIVNDDSLTPSEKVSEIAAIVEEDDDEDDETDGSEDDGDDESEDDEDDDED